MIDLSIYEKQPHAQQIAEILVGCITGVCPDADDDIKSATDEAALQSPLLKLVKERNEARRLCKLIMAAMPDLTHCYSSDKALRAAMEELHVATMTYLKTSKGWDERSYK